MAEQYTGTVDKSSIMSLDWGGDETNGALSGQLIQDGLKDFLKHVPTYSVIVGKNIYMFANEADYTAWVADGSSSSDSRIISKSPAIKGSDLLKSGTLEATWNSFSSKIISGDTCVLSGLKFTARTYDDDEVLQVTTQRVSYKITAEDAEGNVSTVAESSINSGSTVKNINLYKFLVSSETVEFTISASFTVNGQEVKYDSDKISLIKSNLSLSFSDSTFWKDRIVPGSTYSINFKALGSGELTAHADFYALGASTPSYSYTNATLFQGGTNKSNTFNFSETDTRVIEEGIYTVKFYLTTTLGEELVSTTPISKNMMVAASNSSKDLVCVNLSTDTVTNYTSAEVLQFTYNTSGGFEAVTATIQATYKGATYTTNPTQIAVSGQSAIYTYSATVALNVNSDKEPLSGKISISAGDYSYKYPITITNEFQFSATDGASFDFDPTAQNAKSDVYDSAQSKSISTTWTGITWGDTEGYITNYEKNSVLKLYADSSALIKRSLFSDVSGGMTFEIMYRVSNTLDTETPLISCFNSASSSEYNGLKIFAEEIDFRPASTSDSVRDESLLRVCADEVIHLVITYYPNYSDWGFPLTKIFVNGKIAREINGTMLSVVGNTTNTNGFLTLGSGAGDLEIYRMRFYPNSIDDEQVLANYYNVTLDTDQRIEDNTRNKIFSDGEIQFTNIYQKGTDATGKKRALFNCFVLSAWDEYDSDLEKVYAFPSNGSIKADDLDDVFDDSIAKTTDISQELITSMSKKQCILPGFTNSGKSFENQKARIEIFWDNDQYAQNTDVVIELDPDAAVANGDSGSDGALKYQGSSSTNYYRYNWRSKFEKGSKIWKADDYYNTSLSDEEKAALADDGGKLTWYQDQSIVTNEDGSTSIVGSNPVKFGVITAKKNAASSMQTHKAGFDNLYNALYGEYMKDDASYCYNLEEYHRVSAYSAPFLGFVKIPADRTNPDSGYKYRFIGLYTVGNDKGDKTTTGFDNKEWTDIYEIEGAEQAPKFTNFTYPWNDNKIKNTVSVLGELMTHTDELASNTEEHWEVIKYPKEIKDYVDIKESAPEADLIRCRQYQKEYFHKYVKPMYDFVWEHSINILPYEGSVDDLKKGYYPSEFSLGTYYQKLLAMYEAPTAVNGNNQKNALDAYYMYWSVKDPTHTLYYFDANNNAYIQAIETDMDYNLKDATTVHLEYLKVRHQSYTVTETVITQEEVLYTADEAATLNEANLTADANGVEVNGEGYITTYVDGYTPISEGDVKTPQETKTVTKWMVVVMPELQQAELDKIADGRIDEIDFVSKGTYTKIDIESDASQAPYISEDTNTWFVYNVNTSAFEDTTLNAKYYENSVIAETEYETINEGIRTLRAQDFKDNWGTYFNTKDLLLWYTDVVLNAGTDERAKNTYWYRLGSTKKYKTGEKDENNKAIYAKDPNYVPDLKWRMRIDDTDTRFDVDNTGQCVNKYWIEPMDDSVLSGQQWSPNSTFFNLLGHEVFTKPAEVANGSYDYYNVQGAFYYRFKAMSKLATGSETCTSSQVLQCYDKYLFSIADYFPQQAYNQDATFTYEQAKRWTTSDTTHILSSGTDPITQSLGDHKLGDRGFIKNRIIYYMSKYGLGDFNKDQGGTAVVTKRGINAGGVTVDLTFNRWMYYVTYNAEHAIPQGIRLAVNTTYSFPNFLQLANADSGIYGPSYISDLGDWSQLYWSSDGNTVDLYPFSRVKTLTLGNPTLVKFNANVKLQNDANTNGLSALRYLNIENCTSISGSHDLTLSTHLKEVNAFGSNIISLKLAKGTPIEKLYLPETTTQILLNNLEQLTDFKVLNCINDNNEKNKESLYGKLSALMVRNTPNVDGLQMLMDMFTLSESKDIQLRNIWIEGFNTTFTQSNVQSNLNTLMHIADLDDDGTSLYSGFDGTTYDAKSGTSPTLKGTIVIDANYRQNDINNIKAALADPTDLNVIINGTQYVALADFNDPILQAAIYNWLSTKSTGSDLLYYTQDVLSDQFIALTKDPNSKFIIYKLISAANINKWLNTTNSGTSWSGTVTNWLGSSDGKAVSVSQENLRDLSDWSTWFPNSYPQFIAGSNGHKIPAEASVPVNIEYTNSGESINMLSFLAYDNSGTYGLGTVNIVANKGLNITAYASSLSGNTARLVIDKLVTDVNGDFSINTLFRTAKINDWYINVPSSVTCPTLSDSPGSYWGNITNIYVNQKLYWEYLTGETWQGRLTTAGLNFIPYDFDKNLVVDVPTNTTFNYDTNALLFNQTQVQLTDFILTGTSVFEIKFNTCVYNSTSARKVYIFGNSYCYLWINNDGKVEVKHQLNSGSYYTTTGPTIEDLGSDSNITVRYNCTNKVLTINGVTYSSQNSDSTAASGAAAAVGTINSTTSADEWNPADSIFIGHLFYIIHWNYYIQQDNQYNFLTPGRQTDSSGNVQAVYLAETDTEHRYKSITSQTANYSATTGNLVFISSNTMESYTY